MPDGLAWLVGQVYYFKGGKVKPANRAFSAVRYDYTIDFGAGYVLTFTAVVARCHYHKALIVLVRSLTC